MGPSMASPAATSGSIRDIWLFGPKVDLLVGCGLGYGLLVPILFPLLRDPSLASATAILLPTLAFLATAPHYGATLLRVYSDPADRQRYHNFTVWMTLGFLALFPLALNIPMLGSLILTIYITWSPWHFAGQNYGCAAVYLRRGVPGVDQSTRHWLYASFVLSFGMMFLVIHGENPGTAIAPIPNFKAIDFHYMSLGIPDVLGRPALVLLAGLYAISLGVIAIRLGRAKLWSAFVPIFVLVGTQAVWFSIPALLRLSGEFGTTKNLALSTMWISIAHCAQYIWFTSYYAKRSGRGEGIGRFYVKCLLVGSATGVPALILAPNLLGPIPFDAGLAALMFAFVNLHHFILDGVIWKLREGPIARAMLRPAEGSQAGRGSGFGRFAVAVYVVGAIVFGIEMLHHFEINRGGAAIRSGDIDRAEQSLDLLAWVGRDSAKGHLQIADAINRNSGSLDRVETHLTRSLELKSSAIAWVSMARLKTIRGDIPEAMQAYENALGVDPEDITSLLGVASLEGRTGNLDAARKYVERATAVAPNDPRVRSIRERLEKARPGSGNREGAPQPSP